MITHLKRSSSLKFRHVFSTTIRYSLQITNRSSLCPLLANSSPPQRFMTRNSSFSTEIDRLKLEMFPEYKTAELNFKSGQFSLGIPLYSRVFEVLNTLPGQFMDKQQIDSMKALIVHQLVLSYCYSNNAEKAISFLEQKAKEATKDDLTKVVQLENMLAFSYLWQCQFSKARTSAQRALEANERLPHESLDMNAFSPVTAIIGLSEAFTGNMNEAEMYLQMSARWAQTPMQQLSSTINYGALQWFKLAHEGKFNYWQYHHSLLYKDPTTIGISKQAAPAAVSDKAAVDMILGAIAVWQEAVNDLKKPANAPTQSSMCGPGMAGASIAAGQAGMTGLRSDEFIVATPAATHASSADSAAEVDPLINSLSDPMIAISYAQLLCNIAEAHEILGQATEAGDYISSALKAINPHEQDIRTAPVTARLLRMVACVHMHGAQAITAEGLFRSVLEKCATPFGKFDPRVHSEIALTKGFYGQLLHKWDKRVAAGEALQVESKHALESWGKSIEIEKVPLPSFISFPTN